jgi:transposase
MWTVENRARYDRSRLRYPSDLTDDEWALVGPQIPRAKRGGNKRSVDERAVMNGLMYMLSTGCQWRAIPKDLPPRGTVNHYLDLSRFCAAPLITYCAAKEMNHEHRQDG